LRPLLFGYPLEALDLLVSHELTTEVTFSNEFKILANLF